MQVSIAHSEPSQQVWLNFEVPEGTTVREAIDRSGILGMFPSIDLAVQKVGIFGRVVKPETALKPGDRVEIYRPITCDPQSVPRRDGVGGADDD
jgi:putative ubiquitin-RnfH superfamily antitoxin RatB of RatAB toxin-antitoxin module